MPENAAREWRVTPVATLVGDYPDKFGVPRQPGLVGAARAVVSLCPPFDDPLAVAGLETSSHLWLTFIFDRAPARWRVRVRPPRLGGNRRLGVFATRSPQRPNRLGQSLVRLLDISCAPRAHAAPWPQAAASAPSRTHLLVAGHDLVNGTPIVDIKPYLPWAEAVADAETGWAGAPPPRLTVCFAAAAEAALAARRDGASLRVLIAEVLAQDPRPAYRRGGAPRVHGLALRDVDVRFVVVDAVVPARVEVCAIVSRDGSAQPPI